MTAGIKDHELLTLLSGVNSFPRRKEPTRTPTGEWTRPSLYHLVLMTQRLRQCDNSFKTEQEIPFLTSRRGYKILFRTPSTMVQCPSSIKQQRERGQSLAKQPHKMHKKKPSILPKIPGRESSKFDDSAFIPHSTSISSSIKKYTQQEGKKDDRIYQ